MSVLAKEIAEMLYAHTPVFGSKADWMKHAPPFIDQKLSGVRNDLFNIEMDAHPLVLECPISMSIKEIDNVPETKE